MILPLLYLNWNAIWSMTGIGIGIVFVILILLVFILNIFNKVAGNGAKTPESKAACAAPKAAKAATDEDAEMEAAVATAIYLFTAEVHDVESDIITIVNNDRTKWGPIR